MSSDSIPQIARAIAALPQRDLSELCRWLDEHYPQLIDSRIQSDLSAGRLDSAMRRALDDEQSGRTRSL